MTRRKVHAFLDGAFPGGATRWLLACRYGDADTAVDVPVDSCDMDEVRRITCLPCLRQVQRRSAWRIEHDAKRLRVVNAKLEKRARRR